MNRYSVYGLTLESSYAFRTPMADAEPGAPVNLRFTFRVAPISDQPEKERVYASAEKAATGRSLVEIRRESALHRVSFSGVVEFVITPPSPGTVGEIACTIAEAEREYMVEVCLFGHVLAYYLESTGVLALHAGAVEIDRRAVLFVADRTGGKSTVVSAFAASGCPLIADDIAAVETESGVPVCRRAYPQLKMTPDHAARALGSSDGYERVHPAFEKLSVPVGAVGSFARGALPLACMYLLEREAGADGAIRITDVPQAQAVVHLVRHSFLAGIIDETEFRLARFARIAEIARRVRVARIAYPSGLDRLPELIAAVVADVRRARK